MLRRVRTVLVGSVLFAGIPLLGWGIIDISGFLRNPARLAYIVVTILLQVMVAIWLPEVGRSHAALWCQRRGTKCPVTVRSAPFPAHGPATSPLMNTLTCEPPST